MNITNNSPKPLTLPCHTVLPPGVATPVAKWDEYADNAIINAWVKAKLLTVEAPVKRKKAKPTSDPVPFEFPLDGETVSDAE